MNLRPRRRPIPAIPIVSLIDVLVILLIFFIATTTFKKDKEKEKLNVEISLPQSKTLGGATTTPETRTTITVTKDQKVFLDTQPVAINELATALKALKAASPAAKLELEADTVTNLGILVQIWDALREAGYSINDVPARIQRAEGG